MIKQLLLNFNTKKFIGLIIVLFTRYFELFLIMVAICYITFFDKWSLSEIRLTTEFTILIFLLALGHTFIMLVGNIDLALPNIMVLSAVLYMAISRSLLPFFSLTITTLAIIIGTWMYGWTVSKLSINSLAFSLGLLFVIQYMVYFIFRYDTLYEDKAYHFIKPAKNIEIQIILVSVVCILSFFFLHHSKRGIWLKAVGSRTALFDLLIGKRSLVVALAYACAGTLAVLAAMIRTAKFFGAQPTPERELLFYSIGAAILGGVRLSGGRGNVWMALQGSILVGLIIKNLESKNISSDLRLVVFGGIVILVSLFSESIRRKICDVYSIT